MARKLSLIILGLIFLAGCTATVPLETEEMDMGAKEFSPPAEGRAGLYVYRTDKLGKALKKDIWVNGECIGESAPNTYFYIMLSGNQNHKLSTESEFSPNDLLINTKSGKNYFVEQMINMGAFVGGSRLMLTDEIEGQRKVSELALAKMGSCSSSYTDSSLSN
jgi:hypothetical protein